MLLENNTNPQPKGWIEMNNALMGSSVDLKVRKESVDIKIGQWKLSKIKCFKKLKII